MVNEEDKIGFLSVELPAKSINVVNQAEIDELRAEVARLRKALIKIRDLFPEDRPGNNRYEEAVYQIATDALRGEGGDE